MQFPAVAGNASIEAGNASIEAAEKPNVFEGYDL
jgi:hypothetical protein